MMLWLSFCDPAKPAGSQFLGACIVEVPGHPDERVCCARAIAAAWEHGCNPGGEVESYQLPAEKEDFCRPHLNRLMNRREAERIGTSEL